MIVHEWAEASGGAEQVVEQLLLAFPNTGLQLLWNDASDRFPAAHESWLASTQLRRSKILALPFMPFTWRTLWAENELEWMIVSSHLFAHHARFRNFPNVPKLVYAHTPARYIWEPKLDTRGSNPAARIASLGLRPLDRYRSKEAISIAANSEFTRARINKAWQRDAKVIYPPVDTEAISSVNDWREYLTDLELIEIDHLPRAFILGASRFVPYKRLDFVIEAGSAVDLPVVIAGSGPDERRLREIAKDAKVPVHFILNPSTALLRSLYQLALAYIFPAVEDFGIMPIEAMAAGTPVVVPSTGGASETVALTGGGATFYEYTRSSVRSAIEKAASIDRNSLEGVHRFSNSRFMREVRAWVKSNL